MDNQTVIQPYNGIIPSKKKEQTIDKHIIRGDSKGHFAEQKKPVSKC